MSAAHVRAKGLVGDASTRARIWQLTGFACLTVAAFGMLLAWNVARNRDANTWVVHTQTALAELGFYTREILEAETGQRGYLLTRNDAYLAPYKGALANNGRQFERLRQSVTDPATSHLVLQLPVIFKAKLQELARTIQLARAGDMAGAMAIVREGSGRRDTVEFQRLRQEIIDREETLLSARLATAANETRNTDIGMAGGGLLVVLLIIAAGARTNATIEGGARRLMLGISAIAEGRQDFRFDAASRDGNGKIPKAFNAMADRLLSAQQAQERVEADLALSNQDLHAEVVARAAAQAGLQRSVTELKRSNEELDNFAYGASHDLKAPLRGIRNLAEWISEDVKDTAGADTVENLALLQTRVERLDLLLDSLLQYSRVGRAGGVAENIDLATLVRDIGDYLAPRPGFDVTWRGDSPSVLTNKAPLEQVLRNLIGNGLKHHDRDRGHVVVRARDLGEMIEFRVEDDGPGIGGAFHERIFQMFQTLKSRDELEGSGMGLAIVKKSVEGHGGTIHVESAPPARGTAFVFTWKNERVALAA
jgi:signal transduction histidine kinase